MRGDFSRDTFRPGRHYSRVLLQQGRVILDADWNEQAEIQVRLMRRMARDLIGPHGGPADALGFWVKDPVEETVGAQKKIKLTITAGSGAVASDEGRYYVGGILVESPAEGRQRTTELVDTRTRADQESLVYLEVWERHVTWVEENKRFHDGTMREVALGGPDTASRSEVRWRVAVRPCDKLDGDKTKWDEWSARQLAPLKPAKGTLTATLVNDLGEGDPCADITEARYYGPENRLYRVEIHAADSSGGGDAAFPTFKWSRENGSVVYPIEKEHASQGFKGPDIQVGVAHLGLDDRYRLRKGNIVEVVTEALDEAGSAGPLMVVLDIKEAERLVKLKALGTAGVDLDAGGWALLRRWDQPLKPKKAKGASADSADGAILVNGGEFPLEDGIQVSFGKTNNAYSFRVGDYWLIPARTIPGDIEWPEEKSTPHGIERHYAPLTVLATGKPLTDLRKKITPAAK